VASLWPLFDLRVRTPRLELRLPTDDDLEAMVATALRGIHPPDEMPFSVPWTRAISPAFERAFLQYHWGQRAGWEPDGWSLNLGTFRDGEAIGSQTVEAKSFGLLRVVDTGSWLGEAFQGQGYGKEMRAAVLHLAFGGLAAEVAQTAATQENAASLGVTRSLGYEPNGVRYEAIEGRRRLMRHFRLTRERWLERRPFEAEIEGLDGCLELFGAAGAVG
jgi:RimJ/RimL family protein N-acetyltransferase